MNKAWAMPGRKSRAEMGINMEYTENVTQTLPPVRGGVTGSTLKIIAIIAMFIDHTAAIVLERMIYMQKYASISLYGTYGVMRLIGRLGFPIFCFLLIEGLCYTKDVKKYAGRLFLFALVSEIPFDLGFAGKAFYWQYQNVFFTLFIGLLVLIVFRYVEGKMSWNPIVRAVLHVPVLAAGMFAADLLMTDYSGMGVLTIAAMYLCRRSRLLEVGAGCAVLTAMALNEVPAFLAMIPVGMYNGKRGWNLKWIFYVFYPAHILLLYIIAHAAGVGDIMLR